MTGFIVSRPRKAASTNIVATPEQGFRDRDKVLRNTLIDCRDAPSYVLEIQKLWDDAADSFLTIGRYLMRAKRTLKHGEFEHMVRGQLPFNKNAAHRLRRVAEDIDGGRLDQAILPRNYTTIYRFVTMDDETLERARHEGVMNPDVTHKQIGAFVQKLRRHQTKIMPSDDYANLTEKLHALQAEVQMLEKTLAVKRKQLQKLEKALEGQPWMTIDGTARQV
jgi:ADP-heptose:LPS heptosyltransferase